MTIEEFKKKKDDNWAQAFFRKLTPIIQGFFGKNPVPSGPSPGCRRRNRSRRGPGAVSQFSRCSGNLILKLQTQTLTDIHSEPCNLTVAAMSGWWPPVSLVRRSVALLRFPMLPDAARLPRPLRRPPLAAKVLLTGSHHVTFHRQARVLRICIGWAYPSGS